MTIVPLYPLTSFSLREWDFSQGPNLDIFPKNFFLLFIFPRVWIRREYIPYLRGRGRGQQQRQSDAQMEESDRRTAAATLITVCSIGKWFSVFFGS